MCLMHTDLPVPEGPRIIETWPSGMPRFSPRSTRLEPNALWTLMNSIASGASLGREAPVWYWKSSSSAGSAVSRSSATSPSDRGARVGTPEDLRAEHPDQVHEHDVGHHRLGGRRPHSDGA